MKNDRSVIFTIVRVLFAFVTFFVLRIYAKKKGGTGKTFKNILFIISDDLRTDINSYGGPAKTPSLDKFAASPGTVQFDRAYVQQAICCPSRSSFLLGRRPDTTRVWDLKTQFRTSAHGAEHVRRRPLASGRGSARRGRRARREGQLHAVRGPAGQAGMD